MRRGLQPQSLPRKSIVQGADEPEARWLPARRSAEEVFVLDQGKGPESMSSPTSHTVSFPSLSHIPASLRSPIVLASALLLRRMLRLSTVHVVFEVEGKGPLPERRSTNPASFAWRSLLAARLQPRHRCPFAGSKNASICTPQLLLAHRIPFVCSA